MGIIEAYDTSLGNLLGAAAVGIERRGTTFVGMELGIAFGISVSAIGTSRRI